MPEDKTIIFFNSNRAWGGGEKWHLEMAVELRKRGHQVVVFADAYGALINRCRANDIPVQDVSISKLSFLNPFLIHQYSKRLRAYAPAVLILNLPSDMKAGGLAARKAGIHDIYYRRGTALPVNPHLFNRFFYGKVLKGVIANSEQTKSLINKKGQLIDDKKIFVVYNGVKIQRAEKEKKTTDLFTVGNAGRLVYQKGQDYLIQLAEEIKKETNKFEIVIAGDGPLRKKMQREIINKGLSGHIRLMGFQPNLSAFYDSLDVFVLPSRWEGFGYVMVEAMLHQLPVIAFHVSSNPEIIEENKSGFLVPFEDIQAMKEKILHLMNNPGFRDDMGRNAADYASEQFSLQRAANQLEQTLIP